MRTPGSAFRVLILSIVTCSIAGAAETQHSVSFSRQFIIYGLDTRSRGAISELAEQTKANVLTLLRRSDRWVIPVVVNLQLPQANLPEIPPAALRFSQTGAGLKLQVDLTIGDQINRARIERQLLRAVLLEMIYRRETDLAEGTAYVEPPNWLIEGLLALEPGRDRAAMAEALAVSAPKIPLRDFLQLRPESLDAATRELYPAYSFALLQFLVDTSDGEARLGRYIDNLSRASNDAFADLATCFPNLKEPDVARIWQSHLNRLTSGANYQLLTFVETETELAAILRNLTVEIGMEFEQLVERKLAPGERERVMQLNSNLLALGARSHPVLRPIVQQYQQIAAQIVTRKNRHASQRLANLKALRLKLVARMDQIDDYLNWFEATQAQTSSGLFEDYFKASSEIENRSARRNDPLSAYLDMLERQF